MKCAFFAVSLLVSTASIAAQCTHPDCGTGTAWTKLEDTACDTGAGQNVFAIAGLDVWIGLGTTPADRVGGNANPRYDRCVEYCEFKSECDGFNYGGNDETDGGTACEFITIFTTTTACETSLAGENLYYYALATAAPTGAPTAAPTGAPSTEPTAAPTDAPTAPTEAPTSSAPTAGPTVAPTAAPTAPSAEPSAAPTVAPTAPTDAPSAAPTLNPTTGAPTTTPPEITTIALNVPPNSDIEAAALAMAAYVEAQESDAGTVTVVVNLLAEGSVPVVVSDAVTDAGKEALLLALQSIICTGVNGCTVEWDGDRRLRRALGDGSRAAAGEYEETEAPTPSSAPTTGTPTSTPTTAAPTAPTEAPTSSPSSAPTTGAPTSSPTTGAPTSSPTTSAPTEAPTAQTSLEYKITLVLDINDPTADFDSLIFDESDIADWITNSGSSVTEDDLYIIGVGAGTLEITIEIEASQDVEHGHLDLDTAALLAAVAAAAGVDVEALAVASWETENYTPVDFCLGLERRQCRAKRQQKWLKCQWQGDKATGSCEKRLSSSPHPEPIRCFGPCCLLNKRACKGSGVHARKWQEEYDLSIRRSCRFKRDKSMQNQTPDLKSYGKCMPK